MGIVATEIIEDNFVKKETPSYNLSVLIGADRFSYALTYGANHLLALKSYTFDSSKDNSNIRREIQDIFIEDSILTLPYNNVIVGLSNHITTLVPNHLFEEKNTSVYLKAQTNQLNNKTIQVHPIKSLDAQNIYAYNSEVLILIKGYLPNAHFFHASTAMIEGALRTAPNEGTSKIFLNIQSNLVQLLLMDGSKLIFYNNFSFLSSKDLLYYVMLVYDQFKLSPNDIPLIISGHVIKDSEIFNALYKYVNHIEFNNTSPSIHFGEKFRNTSPYFFFDLFSLRLCES